MGNSSCGLNVKVTMLRNDVKQHDAQAIQKSLKKISNVSIKAQNEIEKCISKSHEAIQSQKSPAEKVMFDYQYQDLQQKRTEKVRPNV